MESGRDYIYPRKTSSGTQIGYMNLWNRDKGWNNV
jgi:hypothetical protein